MSKIIKKELGPDLKYIIDVVVEKDEYQKFKERLIEQMAKNVEVKGFRKGKAPLNKALAKIDPIKLQSTLLQETINKYYLELEANLRKEIQAENHYPLNTIAESSPEFTKEQEDGSFVFRVYINVLADIDLSSISKIKVEIPEDPQVNGRLSFDEFRQKEENNFLRVYNTYSKVDKKAGKNSQLLANIIEKEETHGGEPKISNKATIKLGSGMFPPEFEKELTGIKAGETRKFKFTNKAGDHEHIFNYEVECLEVREAKYSKLEDALKNSPEAKKQFSSPAKFEEFLHKIYDKETAEINGKIERQAIVNALVKEVPDFEVQKTASENEINRITKVMEEGALQNKKSLAEVFKETGLPGSDQKFKNDNQVRKAITDYVKNEFKLVEILRAVYHQKVEKKITEAELDTVVEAMKKDPNRYNIKPDQAKNENTLRDIAYDRILRERAYKVVAGMVKVEKVKAKKTKKA